MVFLKFRISNFLYSSLLMIIKKNNKKNNFLFSDPENNFDIVF